MSNEIVKAPEVQVLAVAPLKTEEILMRRAIVLDVMKNVMKPKVDFDTIPGCPKPSLLQPGAEKLLMTFRLAARHEIQDISTADEIRYRVRCEIFDTMSGIVLGDEWGEASTNEEKYAWRRAVSHQEYEATAPERRRLKFFKSGDPAEQVRTNPADMANTVLAIACKRGKVRAARAALAASDLFEIGIEDLPEDIRQEMFGDNNDKPQRKVSDAVNRRQNPGTARPQQQPTGGQRIGYSHILAALKDLGWTEADAEGKDKPSKEGFSFVSKLGKPKAWKEWTPADYADVHAALLAEKRGAVTEGDGPEPPDDLDLADPFADEGDTAQ